jgi:hypothetical protein
MTCYRPVISTESHTQGRRLLNRFDAARYDSEGAARITTSVPQAMKRAQFDSVVAQLCRHFGNALVGLAVTDEPRGRRHSAEFILIGGRTTLIDRHTGADVLNDALSCTALRFSTGRSQPSVSSTPSAIVLSRHALGRFLERCGFRAGDDDAAFAAFRRSLVHVVDQTWLFRRLIVEATRALPADVIDGPMLEGVIRDPNARGAWIVTGLLANMMVGHGGRIRDASTSGVIVRTFLSEDAMHDAQEARVAHYERVLADPDMSALAKAEALRLHDGDRLAVKG